MTVVTLGYSRRLASSKADSSAESATQGEAVLYPLAKQSCHLLLVLTTQSTGFISAVSAPPQQPDVGSSTENSDSASVSRSIFREIGSNPYREALFSLTPLGEFHIYLPSVLCEYALRFRLVHYRTIYFLLLISCQNALAWMCNYGYDRSYLRITSFCWGFGRMTSGRQKNVIFHWDHPQGMYSMIFV